MSLCVPLEDKKPQQIFCWLWRRSLRWSPLTWPLQVMWLKFHCLPTLLMKAEMMLKSVLRTSCGHWVKAAMALRLGQNLVFQHATWMSLCMTDCSCRLQVKWILECSTEHYNDPHHPTGWDTSTWISILWIERHKFASFTVSHLLSCPSITATVIFNTSMFFSYIPLSAFLLSVGTVEISMLLCILWLYFTYILWINISCIVYIINSA